MAFTLLNVVSHGIPYMAMIWLDGSRQYAGPSVEPQPSPRVQPQPGVLLKKIFSRYGIVLFLGIIFFLAYFEEGLWDMTVWKEHVSLFSVFHLFGHRLHGNWLTLVVPLLALPQITHYVIDGFIWRRPKSAHAHPAPDK